MRFNFIISYEKLPLFYSHILIIYRFTDNIVFSPSLTKLLILGSNTYDSDQCTSLTQFPSTDDSSIFSAYTFSDDLDGSSDQMHFQFKDPISFIEQIKQAISLKVQVACRLSKSATGEVVLSVRYRDGTRSTVQEHPLDHQTSNPFAEQVDLIPTASNALVRPGLNRDITSTFLNILSSMFSSAQSIRFIFNNVIPKDEQGNHTAIYRAEDGIMQLLGATDGYTIHTTIPSIAINFSPRAFYDPLTSVVNDKFEATIIPPRFNYLSLFEPHIISHLTNFSLMFSETHFTFFWVCDGVLSKLGFPLRLTY